MAKYDALAVALKQTQATSRTLTFDELDALVPGGLPPSARQYREWWANAVSADGQAASWLGAGWRVETVNLPVQVTFVKQSDAAAPDLEVNVIRRSVLLPALLQTLADAGRPLPRSEALQMMSERVTFTPYELGMAGKTGRTRWSNNTTWMTTSLAAIGWMDKTPQGWSITDAGQEALEQFRSGDSLLAEHNRLYALHVAEQKEGQEYAKPAYDVIRAALSLLGDGQWTSVTDMIEVSGVGASQVKAFVLATSPEGAHRLLLDGEEWIPTRSWGRVRALSAVSWRARDLTSRPTAGPTRRSTNGQRICEVRSKSSGRSSRCHDAPGWCVAATSTGTTSCRCGAIRVSSPCPRPSCVPSSPDSTEPSSRRSWPRTMPRSPTTRGLPRSTSCMPSSAGCARATSSGP